MQKCSMMSMTTSTVLNIKKWSIRVCRCLDSCCHLKLVLYPASIISPKRHPLFNNKYNTLPKCRFIDKLREILDMLL